MNSGFTGHRGIYKPDGSTEEGWQKYKCGHCGASVCGVVVAYHTFKVNSRPPSSKTVKWLLCPECSLGSTMINTQCFPSQSFGPDVEGLPEIIHEAYEEMRRCMQVYSFTASELLCRKILMHTAVEKGAKEGESFVTYINYLEDQGYVTPPMKPWIDIIRKNGNHATHSIDTPSESRARSTAMFTAELLKLIYEMEYLANMHIE